MTGLQPPSYETADWQAVARALEAQLEAPGFDVLGCVAVDAYNATLEATRAITNDDALEHFRLPTLGRPQALTVLVGNTRRLWPRFLAAHADTTLADEAHPLDAYSRLHVHAAAAHVAVQLGLKHVERYSFDPAPNTVAVQRLATLAGVAEASPVGLCVHPQHGPWLSLRAALVFDVPGPAPHAAAPTCSRCVDKPCIEKRERAIASAGVPPNEITREHFEAHWQSWLAIRDACPIGREQRYSDRQIAYHYTKDRRHLRGG